MNRDHQMKATRKISRIRKLAYLCVGILVFYLLHTIRNLQYENQKLKSEVWFFKAENK